MTSPTSRWSLPSWLAVLFVLIFAIAAVLLTRPQTDAPSVSSVSGLVTLKASSQVSMAYDQAMANPKPTLVEFYADWCTVCQAIAPTIESIHREFPEALNLVMLDIDDPRWANQIQDFGVTGVPHLVLLDGQKTVADTFIGKVPKTILRSRVDRVLAGPSASA